MILPVLTSSSAPTPVREPGIVGYNRDRFDLRRQVGESRSGLKYFRFGVVRLVQVGFACGSVGFKQIVDQLGDNASSDLRIESDEAIGFPSRLLNLSDRKGFSQPGSRAGRPRMRSRTGPKASGTSAIRTRPTVIASVTRQSSSTIAEPRIA